MTSVIAAWMALASFAAWTAFAVDKRRAVRGGRRIPEATLHALELIGGWPGALLASRMFRHKSAKTRYRVGMWLCALLNVAGVGLLLWWWWR